MTAASVLNSVSWPALTGRWFRGFEAVPQVRESDLPAIKAFGV
ncbi:hypothetical protein [Limnohabitans sp. 15K]|nr:hypothetical protein [Limnohabitans sp. 15K]